MMRDHPVLARLMLETSEAEWANSRRALRRALDDLRITRARCVRAKSVFVSW
jgi:hypothetical protein